ncbi:hypothetical protein M501DRAFT_956805 [Patellaria atrata CBS 101060]|uniref:Ams2/SPT21 N-terminal domain-containing protein n=1 Tax=Patellaria atrata CBS 101060 TaxID=1346257 RepID=A0A9P4S9B3_9PEZI|nr:hypothetical protein M501DRAFT_956805 [Patellaria atrata CBS 101060]
MRVKVLYTFDDQNKTNCLARLPNTMNIPTIAIDEGTQIGIIELRTCIQAIVAASPELVSKLGHDFTVYAYDYSEYETPLVGQGMLSSVLAAASTTPSAPALVSKTMITGRVCKNILGLFSNGIKETLEVKLKLVPVPNSMQNEFLETMDRYRTISKSVPPGMDPATWLAFIKENPTAASMMAAQHLQNPPNIEPRANSVGGHESLHQLLTQGLASANPGDNFDSSKPGMEDQIMGPMSHSTQPSRSGSPTPSLRASAMLQHVTQDGNQRPGSRSSVTGDQQSFIRHGSFGSFDGRYDSMQDGGGEDGPARKRAKVEKAEWRGRSSFGAKNESLRVTASAAASIRMHRPTPINPGAGNANPLEVPPRAPTPRPESGSLPQARGPLRPASSLRRESTADTATLRTLEYLSPYNPQASPRPSVAPESAVESPEEDASPVDFPSSPPVFTNEYYSPAPSSPVLPTLPYMTDSGFMSDTSYQVEPQKGTQKKSRKSTKKPRVSEPKSEPIWMEVQPGDPDLLPTSILPRPAKAHYRKSRNGSVAGQKTEAVDNTSGNISLDISNIDPAILQQTGTEVTITNGLTFPPIPPKGTTSAAPSRSSTPVPSKPAAKKGLDFSRSQTWSGGDGAPPPPDGPDGDDVAPGSPKVRSGSGARRKKVIDERCQQAIAAGEMPTFCHHCGVIRTPTWRKAWIKTYDMTPEEMQKQITPDDSTYICTEPIWNEGEPVTQCRVYRKNATSEEKKNKVFDQLILCNPCGLWLEKKKFMRPPQFWPQVAAEDSSHTADKPKKKRSKKKKSGDTAMTQQSGLGGELSDMVFTDAPFPPDAIEKVDGIEEERGEVPEIRVSGKRPRAVSMEPLSSGNLPKNTWDDPKAEAALRRAIQSSPAKFLGSQDSPIEIEPDLTPRPTRRLLFPSPRKEGQVKSLEDGPNPSKLQSSVEPTEITVEAVTSIEFNDIDTTDKENQPPQGDDDGLAHLFEEMESRSPHTTPKSTHSFKDLLQTPTTSRSRRGILTPSRGYGSGTNEAEINLLETPTRTSRTGQLMAPMTPFTMQLQQFLSDGVNSSPSKLFDFSMLPNFDTPGRTSTLLNLDDLSSDNFFSTDIPMPSSPPVNMFSLYEDPDTSTAAMWDAQGIFGDSDIVQPTEEQGTERAA